jgi:hypothetical protein
MLVNINFDWLGFAAAPVRKDTASCGRPTCTVHVLDLLLDVAVLAPLVVLLEATLFFAVLLLFCCWVCCMIWWIRSSCCFVRPSLFTGWTLVEACTTNGGAFLTLISIICRRNRYQSPAISCDASYKTNDSNATIFMIE